MGLAARIIPTILIRNSRLVKGYQFKANRTIGNALQAAKVHASRNVDELAILCLDQQPDYEFILALTSYAFTPVSYGGGITSVQIIQDVLANGADKVIIKDGNLRLITQAADRFGSQAIIACINADDPHVTKRVMQAEKAGAGEILLQYIQHDGTQRGYNIPMIEAACREAQIPVIASGGCSGYEDMAKALDAGASAVAAGALFSFTNATPKCAAEYLHKEGYEVRL